MLKKERGATGPWKIEIWMPPVRNRITGRVTKPGFWKIIGEFEADEEAEAAVRFASGQGIPEPVQRRWARARREPPGDGLTGMACTPEYFAKWTGSGGLHEIGRPRTQ